MVATLASACPATPYVFRNYEHPLESAPQAARMHALPGSSAHEVWQAVRASSAAPYYLDDFRCGPHRCAAGLLRMEVTQQLPARMGWATSGCRAARARPH